MRTAFVAAAVLIALATLYWMIRARTPAAKLAALQKEVQPKGGIVFQAELEGQPLAFLLLDCEVFLLDTTGRKVKRTRVLRPGFYLGFTACTGQSIRAEDGYVIATLENRALGAGGGNISGGVFRTRDGRNWEKLSR